MLCCVFLGWWQNPGAAQEVQAEQIGDLSPGTNVRFEASLDAAAVAQLEGRLGGMLDSYLSGIAENRNVALFCDDNCQNIEIFRSAFVLEGDNPILPKATYEGEVVRLDDQGMGFSDLPPSLAHEFARKLMGLDVADMTVIRVRSDRDNFGELGLIAATVLSAITTIVLWLLVVIYPKLASSPIAAPTAEDFEPHSPYLVLLFSMLTLGIYALFWRYKFTSTLRRLTQQAHLVPVVDVIASVFTLGWWGVYADARNGAILDKEPLPSRGYFAVALTFGLIGGICRTVGLWWIGPATQQHGVNELIAQRRG